MRAKQKVQIAVAMVALVVAVYGVFSGVVAAYIVYTGDCEYQCSTCDRRRAAWPLPLRLGLLVSV